MRSVPPLFFARRAMAKPNAAPGGKPATKAAIYQKIAEATKLTKKQVTAVFDELVKIVKRELSKKGPGVVSLPGGLVKLKRVHKEATPARPGRNPATGQPMMI